MRRLVTSTAFLLAFLCAVAQDIEKLTFEDLQAKIESSNGNLRVFNFWATWCKPCIEEMPHFEAANSKDDVNVIFVSLDFAGELNRKVIPFVKKKLSESELDDVISKMN